jgi:integrase
MTGHIRRRGERSWELKFDTGADPLTGKRQIRYHSVKGTKREAQAKLIELLNDAARGTLVDYSKETLANFLTRWDRDWAANNVSPKTAERYRQLIVNQIVPHIGAMPLQRVRPSNLAEFYAVLLRNGGIGGSPLAARTVGHVHRLLRRAFGHAVTWGLIQQNPATSVHPPRVASKEIEIASENEIKAVLQYLRDRNHELYTIATVALATGARRGELCALKWKDFDLESGKLRIERSLETTRAGLRIKSPKTRHGRRIISIPAAVTDEMRTYWKAQQEQRLALGMGRSGPDDLIFAVPDGTPRKPNALTNDWLRATLAVGRRINLHSLRHHHASSLIAAGIDVLTISRRLGHANPSITLTVYGHLYPNTDDRAAQVVEALFARVRTE